MYLNRKYEHVHKLNTIIYLAVCIDRQQTVHVRSKKTGRESKHFISYFLLREIKRIKLVESEQSDSRFYSQREPFYCYFLVTSCIKFFESGAYQIDGINMYGIDENVILHGLVVSFILFTWEFETCI